MDDAAIGSAMPTETGRERERDAGGSDANSLVTQLRVIEDQPLDSRAVAFVHLHDALQHRLEGGDSPTPHG